MSSGVLGPKYSCLSMIKKTIDGEDSAWICLRNRKWLVHIQSLWHNGFLHQLLVYSMVDLVLYISSPYACVECFVPAFPNNGFLLFYKSLPKHGSGPQRLVGRGISRTYFYLHMLGKLDYCLHNHSLTRA